MLLLTGSGHLRPQPGPARVEAKAKVARAGAPQLHSLQDGGPLHNGSNASKRRSDDQIGHIGLLHALPHQSKRPTFHEVHVGGHQVRVHRDALWFGSSSEALHKNVGTGDSAPQVTCPKGDHLSGRHPVSRQIIPGVCEPHINPGGHSAQAGLRHSPR